MAAYPLSKKKVHAYKRISLQALVAYAVPYLIMLYAIHVGWMTPNIKANPHYFWAHHAGTGMLGAMRLPGL